MLKIAIDSDNVLADTTEAWVRCYNDTYNENLKKSDLSEYHFWDTLNISRDEAFKIFTKVWTNWKALPLVENDSCAVVNRIAKLAEVDLVSSALADMKDWIADKDLKFNKIIYTQHKSLLDYDIFVEDSPYEALKIVDNGRVCLLYDQPWNRTIKETNMLVRIKHLSEAIDLIFEYSRPIKRNHI